MFGSEAATPVFRNAQGRGVTVAVHARDVPEAIIRRIIAQAGLSEEEWASL